MPDRPASLTADERTPLGLAQRGFRGHIAAIHVAEGAHGLSAAELEQRLLELGFVEGATVEVLHQGLFGGDPIAVRVATPPSRCAAARPWRSW